MNSYLFLQYDVHDSCYEIIPCAFSQTRRPQQYKRILSCVLQWRSRFPCFFGTMKFYKGIAAGIGISNFLRAFLMVSLNSSSSGSMKKIPRSLLAFSSVGFSMVHLGFSVRFDVSEISFQVPGHKVAGLKVVCFLVSLLLDHVCPSGCFSLNLVNLHQHSNNRQYSIL